MKFEDNRIPYRVRMWYAEKEREEREEFMRLFEEKYKSLFEGKLITTREDVLKDIEVNVERTKNAMRKDVQEKAAIIIERDERIASLEKQLAEAREAYPARWDGLAPREKMKEMRAIYLKEMRADDIKQQGPSPPSA